MKYRVWECKIVVSEDAVLPSGFDNPPRSAACAAVEAAGIPVIGCFSGWGASLDDGELAIVKAARDRKETSGEQR